MLATVKFYEDGLRSKKIMHNLVKGKKSMINLNLNLKLFFLLAIFFVLPNFADALVTTPSIAGGTYTTQQTVQLSCTDAVGCTETRYCLGQGCTPNKHYYAQSEPVDTYIYMTGDAVLRYQSKDTLGNWEAIRESVYNVNLTTPVIHFTNGKWETSFNCGADWFHGISSTLNCDGLGEGGGWVSGFSRKQHLPPAGNEKSEEILASANNPGGVPGSSAQLHYLYTGMDGTNCDCNEYDCTKRATNCPGSGGLKIKFEEILQEYWIRWYQYFPTEMGWGAVFSGGKILYIDHDYTAGWYFMFPARSGYLGTHFQTRTTTSNGFSILSTDKGYGDDWLESNNRQGFGRWIPVEIHLKNDTNDANGIYQVWVDGVLVQSNTALDFGWSEWPNTIKKIDMDGFREILIGSNTNGPVGAPDTNVAIRYDDFAIHKTTPPNVDASGNPFIGPIVSSDATAPSAPTGLGV